VPRWHPSGAFLYTIRPLDSGRSRALVVFFETASLVCPSSRRVCVFSSKPLSIYLSISRLKGGSQRLILFQATYLHPLNKRAPLASPTYL